MNKRAKMRLIGVAAIVVVIAAVAWGIIAMMSGNGNGIAASTTVAKVNTDKGLQGKEIQVSGKVVSGSYDSNKRPMEFDIQAETDTSGKGDTVHVVYDGQVPSTFGDGVVAIVTGKLKNDTVTASQMITKCPSKYESAPSDAVTPKSIKASSSMVGKTVKVVGGVVPGSINPAGTGDQRFIIESESTELPIVYSGALPDTIKDGSAVVITGKLESDGKFHATSVAEEKSVKTS